MHPHSLSSPPPTIGCPLPRAGGGWGAALGWVKGRVGEREGTEAAGVMEEEGEDDDEEEEVKEEGERRKKEEEERRRRRRRRRHFERRSGRCL